VQPAVSVQSKGCYKPKAAPTQFRSAFGMLTCRRACTAVSYGSIVAGLATGVRLIAVDIGLLPASFARIVWVHVSVGFCL
jgi:hypothetical protein